MFMLVLTQSLVFIILKQTDLADTNSKWIKPVIVHSLKHFSKLHAYHLTVTAKVINCLPYNIASHYYFTEYNYKAPGATCIV